MALADRVIAASKLVRDSVDAGVAPEKIWQVPSGAPPLATSGRKPDPDKFVFIAAGHVSVRKGAHYLLDAWRKLAAPPTAELWFFGNWQLPETWKTSLPVNVIYTPTVSREELYARFDRANVLVFPTLAEGLALTPLQAMSRGLPVSLWPLGHLRRRQEKAPAAISRKGALAKNGSEIEIWGDGLQTRSFMYIDDCVEGQIRLMASDFRDPLNLGRDDMISVDGLVKMISGIAGKNLSMRHDLSKPQGAAAAIATTRCCAKCWAGSHPSHSKRDWRLPIVGSKANWLAPGAFRQGPLPQPHSNRETGDTT